MSVKTTVEEYPGLLMADQLFGNASLFCSIVGTRIIKNPILGHGTDGSVWRSTSDTAVKAFFRETNFENELECYQRFEAQKISEIDGLAIPILERFDRRLMVIQMSIVQPPFLLDFGKVYIDRKPPYSFDKQLMANWFAEVRDLFEDNADRVHGILYQLQQFGIHYVDPKPGNIHF